MFMKECLLTSFWPCLLNLKKCDHLPLAQALVIVGLGSAGYGSVISSVYIVLLCSCSSL